MTRLEALKTFDRKAIAEMLCYVTRKPGAECEKCIAYAHCHLWHTGFLDWLDEEYEMEE
nr:MAG TPA: hypothetical protein [Caudoviricetes sp.]